jgi:HEPN domain-containing protein
VNRAELKVLAADRIDDAQILLNNGRWPAAYYLAGYAVECALKACILAYVDATGIIFKDRRFAERCWTHNLDDLLVQADLEVDFGLAMAANPTLANNWGIVRAWTEASRYVPKSEGEARALHRAISDDPDGVLRWLQTRW